MPSLAHITARPANAFPNILAANVPNNTERNPPIVALLHF